MSRLTALQSEDIRLLLARLDDLCDRGARGETGISAYLTPREAKYARAHYFANKGHPIIGMVFPVVTYGCENWTIKKAERRRINAFELWCWRRLLRILWTARRSNQSILKEINPGYSLEGLMLKLKLQYFCHLMRRADSFEKTLMLGRVEGRRRRERQRMRCLDGITDSMDAGVQLQQPRIQPEEMDDVGQ